MKPRTYKQLKADPRVSSVERYRDRDSYSVMIYLADGWVAEDGTSTLYGRTLKDACKQLHLVAQGEPV